MPFLELALVALALSVDAFAVALAAAATGRVGGSRGVFRLSFHFGLFQFLMPVLGWAAGSALSGAIASVDHWLAFALLGVVGVRMLRSARRFEGLPRGGAEDPSRGMSLLALSTAVSIDALAVGLGLGMMRIRIWTPGVVIGLVASAMSLLGILLGSRLHERYGRIAEAVGGVILIAIAVRIVYTHLTAQ
jgi:putative Mn2+ efflux pump MntP